MNLNLLSNIGFYLFKAGKESADILYFWGVLVFV